MPRRITRRQALAGGTVAAGGAVAAMAGCGGEEAAGYPRTRIARLDEIEPNVPVGFEYPLAGQQGVLLDLRVDLPGGVGPHGSLVAFNIACQHMGCPVAYRANEQRFVCNCHQTVYDPAHEGFVVQGVAQRPLPRIALEVTGRDVFATGVQGLIFGHRMNLEPAVRS
jgi:arsenite oxidase small subunit